MTRRELKTVSNGHELFAREKKAGAMARTLWSAFTSRHEDPGFIFELHESTPDVWNRVAQIAGQLRPSESTWKRTVELVAEFYRNAELSIECQACEGDAVYFVEERPNGMFGATESREVVCDVCDGNAVEPECDSCSNQPILRRDGEAFCLDCILKEVTS